MAPAKNLNAEAAEIGPKNEIGQVYSLRPLHQPLRPLR